MIQVLEIAQPPTVNVMTNINRTNARKAGRVKKQWTSAVVQAIRQQHLDSFPGSIWVLTEFTYKNSNCDPDNLYGSLKPVFDGLVKAEIIKNDTVTTIKSPQLFSYKKGDERLIKIWMFDDKRDWLQVATDLGLVN